MPHEIQILVQYNKGFNYFNLVVNCSTSFPVPGVVRTRVRAKKKQLKPKRAAASRSLSGISSFASKFGCFSFFELYFTTLPFPRETLTRCVGDKKGRDLRSNDAWIELPAAPKI